MIKSNYVASFHTQILRLIKSQHIDLVYIFIHIRIVRLNLHTFILLVSFHHVLATVLPAKSDSDLIFCLQLLDKKLTCTLHLS